MITSDGSSSSLDSSLLNVSSNPVVKVNLNGQTPPPPPTTKSPLKKPLENLKSQVKPIPTAADKSSWWRAKENITSTTINLEQNFDGVPKGPRALTGTRGNRGRGRGRGRNRGYYRSRSDWKTGKGSNNDNDEKKESQVILTKHDKWAVSPSGDSTTTA